MNLKPQPLTVANVELLKSWQTRLTQYIDEHGKKQIGGLITKMYIDDEQFRKLVDDAIASQGTFTQEQLDQWVKSNLVAASRLNVLMKTMPNTIQSLMLGIECMKATVDQSSFTEEQQRQFASEEYWNHISIEDVREYCAIIIDLM